VYFFIFISLASPFTPFTFLPSFYGCIEEVLVLVFFLFMFLFFFLEWIWNGREGDGGDGGPGRGCIGLGFVGGFYFYFFTFYFFTYLCAGHFERVSFSFLICIVLYSFFLILTF